MRWRLLGGAVVLALAASASAAVPAAAQDLPPGSVRWLRVEGPHFTLISDAKEKAAREVLDDLEGLHRLLSSVRGGPSALPVRTFVFAFRDGDSLANYSPWPDRMDVAGFFVSGAYRNYMGIDASTLDSPTGVAYHEYLHFFADTSFPEVPLWFNEGLAEYYSTFRVEGRYAHIGRPREEHLEWLRGKPLIGLSDLLSVTTDSPLYNEADRAGSFYAQSWAMVHYLFADDARAAGVGRFLGLLGSGQPVERSFVEAFGVSYEAFESSLRDYVRSRSFSYLKVPVERRSETFLVTVLDAAEAVTILGDFAANLGPQRAQQARRHFEEALRLDLDWGPAHVGLGWLCHQRDELECAIDRYRHAATLTGGAPVGLFLLGEALLEKLEGSYDGRALAPPQRAAVAEARHSLARALELDPELAPALVALGWTYLYDGPPEEGIEVFHRAAAVLPAEARVLYGLALLNARSRDFGRAWSLADQLAMQEQLKPVALARRELVPQLRTSIARQQLNLATDEANAGESERAIQLVTALRPRLDRYQLTEEDGVADEIVRHARHNLAVGRVEEARALRAEGELRRALTLIEAAIPDLAEPAAVSRAEDLARRVRAELDP